MQKIAINTISQLWDNDTIPGFMEFIKIPSKSIDFDAEWQQHGYLTSALQSIANWAKQQNIVGLKASLHQLPNCPPVLLLDIPGSENNTETLLFYSHADKVPEGTGWSEGLGAWQPKVRDDRLFGRGAIDDGYAPFAVLTAIKYLQSQQMSHARCVLIIETAEESGSPHFADYLQLLKKDIGSPQAIFFLDTGGPDNERLWQTTSTRGHILGILSITLLTSRVHSGEYGGIVPSIFSIARELLERIENSKTGEILVKSANVSIPEIQKNNAAFYAKIRGKKIYSDLPWAQNSSPLTADPIQLVLNNTWRPSLAILGADGLPVIKDASNTLLPQLKLKLSLRIPPSAECNAVIQELKNILEINPPYNSSVSYTPLTPRQPWLSKNIANKYWSEKLKQAAKTYYNNEAMTIGCGAGIGAIAAFVEHFPAAEIILTGIDTPACNLHGPDESIHLPTVKKFTCCLAQAIS
jgi:acetylornithine deacetylase/succinyl-diaminopimelate desuccinylase-like protein